MEAMQEPWEQALRYLEVAGSKPYSKGADAEIVVALVKKLRELEARVALAPGDSPREPDDLP